MRIENSPIILENVIIEKSHPFAAGARLKNTDVIFRNCLVSENNVGLKIEGGAPIIDGCQFLNKQIGILASQNSAPEIVAPVFDGNMMDVEPESLWP